MASASASNAQSSFCCCGSSTLALDFVGERLRDAAGDLQLRRRGSAVEAHFEADAEFAVLVLGVLGFAPVGAHQLADVVEGLSVVRGR